MRRLLPLPGYALALRNFPCADISSLRRARVDPGRPSDARCRTPAARRKTHSAAEPITSAALTIFKPHRRPHLADPTSGETQMFVDHRRGGDEGWKYRGGSDKPKGVPEGPPEIRTPERELRTGTPLPNRRATGGTNRRHFRRRPGGSAAGLPHWPLQTPPPHSIAACSICAFDRRHSAEPLPQPRRI